MWQTACQHGILYILLEPVASVERNPYAPAAKPLRRRPPNDGLRGAFFFWGGTLAVLLIATALLGLGLSEQWARALVMMIRAGMHSFFFGTIVAFLCMAFERSRNAVFVFRALAVSNIALLCVTTAYYSISAIL